MTIHPVDFGSASWKEQKAPRPTKCSALDLELVRLVFSMPDQARAKLLAFLHLSRGGILTEGDLVVGETGEVHLSLLSTPSEAS